jgi:hypothetical protein
MLHCSIFRSLIPSFSLSILVYSFFFSVRRQCIVLTEIDVKENGMRERIANSRQLVSIFLDTHIQGV